MCKVTFYRNDDYGSQSDSYSYPQAKESGVMSTIDSFKTDGDAWVVVYNGKYFQGDWLKAGPNSAFHDLNETPRSNEGGDWKNQIQSFVMYDHKPAFWDNTHDGGPYIDLAGSSVYFTENTGFSGDNTTYTAPGNHSGLPSYTTNPSKDMTNTINSLATGPQGWLVIYDQENFKGNYLRIMPNTKYDDMKGLARGDDGDWKNDIMSFQLYNQHPADWGLSFNLDTFRGQFTDYYSDNTISGNAIGYLTQDCQFRVYDPLPTFPTTDTMVLTITIDHIIDMSTDDHAVLTISFDADGSVNDVGYTWDAGSAYQVPDGVVKAVDATVEMAGAIGALETCGISEEAAQVFLEVFDTSCKVFNDLSNAMAKVTDNDGGRFYMICEVAHVITRACNSVVVAS